MCCESACWPAPALPLAPTNEARGKWTHEHDTASRGPRSHRRRGASQVRRRRRHRGADDSANQPVAGEPVRVHAHLGDPLCSRPALRRGPPRVRRIRRPRRPARPARHGRVPRAARRRDRTRPAVHRRTGRRDPGRPVRGRRPPWTVRRCGRGRRRHSGPTPAGRTPGLMGARPRSGEVSGRRPARGRERRDGRARGKRFGRHPRRLSRVLRG